MGAPEPEGRGSSRKRKTPRSLPFHWSGAGRGTRTDADLSVRRNEAARLGSTRDGQWLTAKTG